MGMCVKCGLEQGHNIGDVGFLRLRPEGSDPERITHYGGKVYEIFSEIGDPRVALLRRAFRQSAVLDGWQLWACPYSGGWHAIDYGDVNWATSSIPEEGA